MKTFVCSMNFKQLNRVNDLIERNYIEYYKKFDICLLPVSNAVDNPIKYCRHFGVNGIILTGGTDIENELIHAEHSIRKAKCRGRSAVEWQLLEMAIDLNLPVLGICRGMQFINLFFGGDVILNIDKTVPGAFQHTGNDHTVLITDVEFQDLMKCDSLPVNSFHNHGMSKNSIAPGLYDFAVCVEDKSVEGIFHPNYPIMGIQWHPERRASINDNEFRLLNAFFTNGKFWKGK